MKFILTLLAFLNILFSYSQESFVSNAKVEYELIINLDKYKGTLYFNENRSHFLYHSLNDNNLITTEEKKIDENDINIAVNIKIADTLEHFIFIDKTKKELFSTAKDFKNNELVLIQEPLPGFKWKILNEDKVIGGFKCKKATTEFRGRNYIAWYSSEIPSYFGPMKFNQLPGLILEIYDDKQEVFIQISKITYPFKEKILLKNKYKYISKKDYKKLKNLYLKKVQDSLVDKINIALLKLNRDVKISNIKINSKIKKKQGIELDDEN